MKQIFILLLILPFLHAASIKNIGIKCMCDISDTCDNRCCCDQQCSSTTRTYWNENRFCVNDGFTIPFCSALIDQSYHVHDLYQGLRLIYTIVRRLFCISSANFVDPTAAYSSSGSSNSQSTPNQVSATNPAILQLNTLATYQFLPNKNGAGLCMATTALRSLQNVVGNKCRVFLSTVSDLSNNPLLSVNRLVISNNLDNTQFKVFTAVNPTSISQTSVTASSISSTCTTSGSNSLCNVIKQLNLFFIASTGNIDYTASYAVVGQALINGPSYIYIKYSYTFIQNSNNLPYTSKVGYSWNTQLVFLKKDSNNYYRIFNPINLAYRQLNGACRISGASSDNDPAGLLTIRFGQNSIHSCIGSTSLLADNIKNAISHVGSIGSAGDNIQDYVSLQIGDGITPGSSLQLLFFYVSIGTRQSSQFKILKMRLNGVTASTTNQPTLFVQFSQIVTSVVMNVPPPPAIDAYLPDDFLYPFNVA